MNENGTAILQWFSSFTVMFGHNSALLYFGVNDVNSINVTETFTLYTCIHIVWQHNLQLYEQPISVTSMENAHR